MTSDGVEDTHTSIFEDPDDAHVIVYFWTAGGFALTATLIALIAILQHLRHYVVPDIQRQIVRIIFIVPLFALTSWLSIGYPYAARYFELARSIYEAFAVLSFFYLLVQYLGGEQRLIRILIARQQRSESERGGEMQSAMSFSAGSSSAAAMEEISSSPSGVTSMEDVAIDVPDHPSNAFGGSDMCGACCAGTSRSAMRSSVPSYFAVKRSILQFVMVMPILAILSVFLDAREYISEGYLSPTRSYTWINLVHLISVIIAMAALLRFFRVFRDYLRPFRPVPKFVTFKAVIFIPFFQRIVIDFIYYFVQSPTLTAHQLQFFMASIEMLPIAIAHAFFFSSGELEDPAVRGEAVRAGHHNVVMYGDAPRSPLGACCHAALCGDVIGDVRDVMAAPRRATLQMSALDDDKAELLLTSDGAADVLREEPLPQPAVYV